VTSIVSVAWSQTAGGVSGQVESCCLGTTSFDDETGAEIGGDTVDTSIMRLMPTTRVLGAKMLQSLELLNNNQ
jgi:hypothetical protein